MIWQAIRKYKWWKVGLSTAVVERMKWEQERVGWNGEEKQIRVKKVEEFKCTNGWKKFGCRVFVETFVLKTLEGSIVLTYAFRHHDQLWSKWEWRFQELVLNQAKLVQICLQVYVSRRSSWKKRMACLVVYFQFCKILLTKFVHS